MTTYRHRSNDTPSGFRHCGPTATRPTRTPDRNGARNPQWTVKPVAPMRLERPIASYGRGPAGPTATNGSRIETAASTGIRAAMGGCANPGSHGRAGTFHPFPLGRNAARRLLVPAAPRFSCDD